MAQDGIVIIRVELARRKSLYREIEIDASESLFALAEAITRSFDFNFDHAFGFYTGLKSATMMRRNPRYELFADMEGAAADSISVKKTRISQAFRQVGHTMMFLFDYGDEWLFRVSLKGTGARLAEVGYPRVAAARGKSPPQYPDSDDEDEW
jgi:hypothetical protein